MELKELEMSNKLTSGNTLPEPTFTDEGQPTIPYANETTLDPALKEVMRQTREMLGVVPNAAKTYANRPEIAKAIHPFYSAIVLSESSCLDIKLKNKLGIICSSTNHCLYCTSHQCSLAQNSSAIDMTTSGLTDDELMGLISGIDEGKDETERLCFEFARVASRGPSDVSIELLDRMKAHLSTEQIVELGCVVAMWKFFNTMHDSLHIPSETGMAKYSGILESGQAELLNHDA
jgi:uncharacterized peroxidase-related enzyme